MAIPVLRPITVEDLSRLSGGDSPFDDFGPHMVHGPRLRRRG
ncbi:hypothetical protein [Microlunatus endophyticus]|nr:hypothetical protein [Microlunatus endophyticus]